VSPHVVCISSFPAICRALYFDATAPPPGEWTLIGSNPPEIGAVHGTAFRMSALSAHGKTVVVLIKTDAATFAKFLPVAERLLASLRFASS